MSFLKQTKRSNYIPVFLLLLLLISCNQNHKNEIAKLSGNSNNNAIEVYMEGRVFQIKQENVEPNSKSIFKKDSIFLEFWENGNPLKLNLNLTDTNILEKGHATYIIPDANSPEIMVDLNFYNANRDTKRMNKRIIFRKGIIEIEKISDTQLQMKFEGEAGGMLNFDNNFPISGKVNVNY
ncbi:hypothetical protein [Ulvibacter antarcticus]|uniref:LPS export ABC transporter protein LptC n=1 Tax=Ulvibacter antarcticus TaxID=442714 RepID=A0A3L9YGW4_9FLAO|nr:hypothetical protein [Ulvibacter antarcticus]RMA58797.1 hypothetical protein BXY75_2176 [Ulvibacter antarcticus]